MFIVTLPERSKTDRHYIHTTEIKKCLKTVNRIMRQDECLIDVTYKSKRNRKTDRYVRTMGGRWMKMSSHIKLK